jgi:hypothetical protein
MSEKKKIRVKKNEEKQQKQASKIIEGIFIALIVITIAFMIVFSKNS